MVDLPKFVEVVMEVEQEQMFVVEEEVEQLEQLKAVGNAVVVVVEVVVTVLMKIVVVAVDEVELEAVE